MLDCIFSHLWPSGSHKRKLFCECLIIEAYHVQKDSLVMSQTLQLSFTHTSFCKEVFIPNK